MAIDHLRESQGQIMCCEVQEECSGRATLPRGWWSGRSASQKEVRRKGASVRPGASVSVKMHKRTRAAYEVDSSGSGSGSSGRERLMRTGRLGQRRGGVVA